MEPQSHAARRWTLAETHTLLDLIRDLGFIQALTQTGYQNWEVYERISLLLGRWNIHVSSVEVNSHWRTLKVKFFRLRRLLDKGLMQVSAIGVGFPFYEEMDQLLNPQSRSCKREADSSGQFGVWPVAGSGGQPPVSSCLEEQDFPSSYEHQASSSTQEADEGAGLAREAPLRDVTGDAGEISGPDIQRLVVMLCRTAQQLMDVVERLSTVEEQLSVQLGYMCSAAMQMTHQPYNVSSERHHSPDPADNLMTASSGGPLSRAMRRGLRRLVRHHP